MELALDIESLPPDPELFWHVGKPIAPSTTKYALCTTTATHRAGGRASGIAPPILRKTTSHMELKYTTERQGVLAALDLWGWGGGEDSTNFSSLHFSRVS